MMPDATKWVFDTIALIVVVGIMIGAAFWTSGTSKRK
jgi:hypothetical protein